MGFKLSGLDEFKGKLNKVEKSFKQLNERKGVSFDDLFTKSFMENYTIFLTFNDFFNISFIGYFKSLIATYFTLTTYK